AIEYIKAGKLRALAVTSPRRFEALPDVPAMAEYVPGYEASLLTGLGAPSADPKIKAQLAALGNTVLPGSPADFGRLIAKETDKWAKVIKFANIKPQ
ncbi:MAG TPA: tripartite tricarboxylate transporter substrate-binding protein, partial [Xanthobacteraceae bacterium]|nr:tripartite tricarboxylate transporter substrate-binding protein [Xanthobacteraceae bacterium]